MTAEPASAEEQQLDRAIMKLGTPVERTGQTWIQFDNLAEWLGLEIERDENGAIVSASQSGQTLDPSRAKLIENQLKHAKFFYDLSERTFRGQGLDSIRKGDLAKAVTERAKLMIDEQAGPDQIENSAAEPN
jgi:hypothetical protein